MRLSDAFAATLFRFRQEFNAADLAEASGVTANQISSFQRGGNLRSDSLDRLFDGLERLNPSAKTYMLTLLAVPENYIGQGFQAPPPPAKSHYRER